MEALTLGDLSNVLIFLAGIITSGATVAGLVSKRFGKVIQDELKPTNEKIDKVAIYAKEIEMSGCKNYLVSTISDIQNGDKLDNISKERFLENYDKYLALGGNSYVKHAVEDLKKEGKL